MNAARCRASASSHSWNRSQSSGEVCPSRRISQATAVAATSLAAIVRLPALAETVEESPPPLAERLVEKSVCAMAGGLGELLLDRVLRYVHPGRDLLLRVAVHLAQGEYLPAALG